MARPEAGILRPALRRLAAALVLSLAGAAPALADEDQYAIDPDILLSCLAAGEGTACIQRAADHCMNTAIGGETTNGSALCLNREYEFWAARLAAVEAQLLPQQRAYDREYRSASEGEGAGPGPGETAMADLQAGFEIWREAQCRFEAVQFWGGSGMGPVSMACLLRLTAEQALRMEALWDGR